MQIKLDFSINDSTGRRSFVDNYVKEFGEYLTDDNLEMLSNYILWAVEREEGLDFGIESKRTPWKGKTV